jgi:nucleotide-binding universal stress UspA family protein
MYDTILVATDGSDDANAALDHALDLAESRGGAVHVVTVVDTTANPMKFGVVEVSEIDRAASELVEDIVGAYDESGVEVHGDVRRGKPAEVLLEYADEIDADLILAGQRDADGISGAILGSTTDRLARLTTVPLLIVPAEEDAPAE